MARGKRASSSASDTNHLAGDSLTESFSPSGGAFETESSQISKVARGRPSRDMQGGAATSFEDEARKTPSKLKADGTSPRSPVRTSTHRHWPHSLHGVSGCDRLMLLVGRGDPDPASRGVVGRRSGRGRQSRALRGGLHDIYASSCAAAASLHLVCIVLRVDMLFGTQRGIGICAVLRRRLVWRHFHGRQWGSQFARTAVAVLFLHDASVRLLTMFLM
jgi:hypothetical protein